MKIDFEEYEITYRQFDHWCRRNWIRAREGDPGSGYDRNFSRKEVQIFKIMAPLVKRLSFRPSVAAELARVHVVNGFTGSISLEDGELELRGIFASIVTGSNNDLIRILRPPEGAEPH
jgi:hypothetical protein